MSTIRKQSILSTIVIYIGFGVGLLNTYLFARKGIFLDDQFGIYNAFIAIATIMMAFSNMGIPTYINKFYPYYKHHLPNEKNDQLGISILIGSVGAILLLVVGTLGKNLFIRKYSGNSPEIINYYFWIFPLAIGLLLFNILEAYAWQLRKSVLTNLLREGVWRFYTLILILLFASGFLNGFDLFIKLFAFSYPFIAICLLVYLIWIGEFHLTFKISNVTEKFKARIFKLCSFVYSGSLVFTIALMFDSILIGSVLQNGMAQLAVYSLAQSLSAMIQVPQRGIVAASMGPLSKAWREKNLDLIQTIYKRSSINQLLFAIGIFSLIVLNLKDAVHSFQLKETYLLAITPIVFLGLTKIVDMGTGVNSQIIATSVYWRFEMISGMILLCIMLPFSYFMTKYAGINGTAIAQLVSISIYNLIRMIFLWNKFKLSPFTKQTISAVAFGGITFAFTYFLFKDQHRITGITIRSVFFIAFYAIGIISLKISPDIQPVWNTIKKRLGIVK